MRHENEGLGQEGAAASCGTHSDTAAHRHRSNAASDVRSGRASDAQGAAAVRGVPAGYPVGGVPAAGDLPHWKGPAQGAARHGAGMQRRWVSVRVSLVNADAMLMARPYPVSLLCHFHRGAVAAQRGLWPSRKRTRLQYNSSGVSADMEAASAFCHTVRSADRSSVPLIPKAVAPYPAAASGRLGGQSAGLCDLDRGLWRQIKRHCAASPFHLTVARRSPVFIAASSIAAVLFCVILILEKRYHNSAGARMGSDHTSYGRIANFFQVSFPDVTAVFDIF